MDLTEELNPPDVNGFSTGIIPMSGLPADADIVAAYLYWETIAPTATPELAAGVKFRGHEILLNDVVGVKASSQPLVGSTASCWSSGSPLAMIQFRADVLRFLPIRLDKNNQPTGKRLVNDADLTAHGLPLHSVTLPTRNGNQIPESAGASLVLVYRDPSEPLRKIVFYDGIQILPSLTESMTQTVRGFYRSSTAKSAKLTQIIASGQPNNNERIFFNGGTSTQISPFNPVFGGTSSQRGWATLTYNVTSLMNPGNNSADGYGETVTTTVNHSPGGGTDCLTWGAIIFSTDGGRRGSWRRRRHPRWTRRRTRRTEGRRRHAASRPSRDGCELLAKGSVHRIQRDADARCEDSRFIGRTVSGRGGAAL